MKITDIKINGIKNPLGYLFPSIRISWKITDTKAKEIMYSEISVAKDASFSEILYKKSGKNFNSAAELLDIELLPRTRYYVRIYVRGDIETEYGQGETWFETSKMNEHWKGCWIKPQPEDKFHPVFQKEFSTEKEITQARLYISGLGLYTAKLNGKKIGEEVLTPYYSNYHKECQYQTFDITHLLETKNVLTIQLGNGWYKGKFGLANQKENFGSEFQLLAEVQIEYKDGTRDVIGSDKTWKYQGSDIEESDIYDGEVVNRLLWEKKRNLWKTPVPGKIEGILTERYSLPVLEKEIINVQKVIMTPAGETVLDFGQNFAGYVAFYADFPKGTKITLDFGEILQDGNFYNENYRSAKSRFIYIANGTKEWIKPQFTYFGFRYVRVTGWPKSVYPQDFSGRAVYSDLEQTGAIETGHPKINRLFLNALWGQKSNSVDLPTDCPQRDERLGWTGDAQVFSGTASYNMDMAAFYNKFLHDLRTEQIHLDGVLPGVIPVFDPKSVIFSSVWGDIATFLPMLLYQYYGDREVLKEYYPMMKDWVDKITKEDQKRGQRYLFDFGNQLGDWLALDGRTEQSSKGGTDDYFIASCYYAASVKKTAEAAAILGKTEDETHYRILYRNVYDAIMKEYFTQSGRLCIDTQTAYIVALYFGIYLKKEKITEGLKNRLYKDCYKIKGGFVGAPIMCRVMAENGLEEEAFYFLLQEEYPGWLHCVNLGATTIWERWNSVMDNGRLSGTMMNSLNHYAFGTIVEYLYQDVAGIRPLKPGFQKVEITPRVNQKLKYMKASYNSAYGTWKSEWEILKDGKIHVRITVPFGCRAVIVLPFCSDPSIGEVGAGSHEYYYKPTEDLRCRYTKKTLFKEMMNDKKALEIINRVSPPLWHFLENRNVEFLNESLDTLMGMFFMGFSEDMITELTDELTRIRDEEVEDGILQK